MRLLVALILGLGTGMALLAGPACGGACGGPAGATVAPATTGDTTQAAPAEARVATITTAELKNRLDQGDKLVILDARSGKGDDGKRIAGARQLAPGADDATVAKLLGDNKDVAIVTYCGGMTCPASGKLAAQLRKLGYQKVIEYPEGIAGWIAAGNPVEGPHAK